MVFCRKGVCILLVNPAHALFRLWAKPARKRLGGCSRCNQYPAVVPMLAASFTRLEKKERRSDLHGNCTAAACVGDSFAVFGWPFGYRKDTDTPATALLMF